MSAAIIDFDSYLAADQIEREKIARNARPIFEPHFWPGNDYHEIGRQLRALGDHVRRGEAKDPAQLAELLERYGATCFAIRDRVRKVEDRMIRAEKALRPKGRL